MKRTAALLVLTLISCLSAAAQTAKTRRPALPADIALIATQDSNRLLTHPVIQRRMKKLLGKKYGAFMESFETLTPVTKKGNFLFSSGCLIHACTHLESAIAVDLVNQTIHAAIFRQNEKTRYFNESGRATPGVIRDWANNLSQLNKSPSMSGNSSSMKAEAVTVRAHNRAPVVRMRPHAPVAVAGWNSLAHHFCL